MSDIAFQSFVIASANDVLDMLEIFNTADTNLGVATYQGGGVFQQSPFQDRRSLIFRRFGNATMSTRFTLNAKGTNATKLVASHLQRLRRQLEMAADFWSSDWYDDPVWIEVKVEGESSVRYAYVAAGTAPQVPDYFSGMFHGPDGAITPYLPLAIERQQWQKIKPGGTPTAVGVTNGETFDSLNYGTGYEDNAATLAKRTDKYVWLSGKDNRAQPTHIFRWDLGTTTFSSNILPFVYLADQDLVVNPSAIGDITYFGCDTSVTDAGPFSSVVMNFTVAGVTGRGDWEYWNGGSWAALTVNDRTTEFKPSVLEYKSVTFDPPDDWATTTVNSVTGYWIRFSITTAFTTIPEIGPAYPFTPTWPYIEIDGDDVAGDLPARANLTLYNASGTFIRRVIMALRSTSRGSTFTPHLNMADEQNPSGVTATATLGSIATVPSAPAGKALSWASGGAVSMTKVGEINLDETLTPDWRGKFRIFLRVRQTTGASAAFRFRIDIDEGTVGDVTFSTPTVPNSQSSSDEDEWELLDLGQVSLASEIYQNAYPLNQIEFLIYGEADSSNTIQIADLILYPVDEWAGEIRMQEGSSFSSMNEGIRVKYDSVSNPKVVASALLISNTANEVRGRMQTIQVRHPLLLPRSSAKLFILPGRLGGIFPPSFTIQAQLEISEQYLDLIGAE